MRARPAGRLLPMLIPAVLGVGVAGCGDSGGKSLPLHTTGCDFLPATPRRLWRLSAQQYGNSLKDLLGLPSAPVLSNNGGTADYAFFSDDAAGVDANFQFSIFQTVEATMAQIAPQIPTLAACKKNEAPTACAQRFARSFGLRAFRRLLSNDEVTALMGPFNEGANQDFNTGISLMIESLLLSPSFIFRTELGPPAAVGKTDLTVLTPYEVASQLSYLFRNSTPDAALLAAAGNGSLGTSGGVSQQVDRLLALPEVKQNLTRIVGEWFNVRQVFSKIKDDALLSALPDTDRNQSVLQNDLYTSAQKFIDSTLWTGQRHLIDLLTGNQIFVNQRLATLYGFPFSGDPDTFQAVTAPDTQRSGMLTQPNLMWGLSNPTNTAIVKRGRFVHDDVICEDPSSDPPPGLLSRPDIVMKLAMLPSEIEKSDYRLMTDPCRSCHGLIDPYARVLESFGPIGEYRTMADGVPVDPTADFTPTDAVPVQPLPPGPVTGAPAFVAEVNGNKLFSHCAAQKMASYALGRMIRVNQTCEVLDLDDEFGLTDGSIAGLFKKVATAPFLRSRSGGTQ
jgi:hypothetical protein